MQNSSPTGIKILVGGNKVGIVDVDYFPAPAGGGIGESFGVNIGATLPNIQDPYYEGLSGFQRTSATPNNNYMPLSFIALPMYLTVSKIQNYNTGSYVNINWSTFPFPIYNANYTIPSGLEYSSGLSVKFTWETYPYLRNDARNGVWSGYYRTLSSAYPGQEQEKNAWTTGVSLVSETDSDGSIRTTKYKRSVPTPRNGYSPYFDMLASEPFYTAITYPDGSSLLEKYWLPMLNSSGGPGASVQDQYQTLAHLKHVVKERRYYAQDPPYNHPWVGETDNSASTPETSSAYKIIQYSNLDIRRNGIPVETIQESDIPIPTTVTTWDKNRGTIEVETLQNWVGSPVFAWKDTIKSITQNGTSVYSSITSRSYSPLFAFGLFPRPTSEITTIQSDTTGGLASGIPQSISLPYVEAIYDSSSPILNKIQSHVLTGSPEKITTNYAYQAAGGLGGNRVDNISVSSPNFSGTSGVDHFGYDSFGQLQSIQLKGASWSVGQNSDELGRTISQTNPFGLVTSFKWDGADRLTDINPPAPEVQTSIVYSSDQRQADVTRGAQKTVFRYNGFGETILIQRWKSDGTPLHKTFGYDLGGRKTFESVWLSGQGSDTESNNNSALVGDRWEFDSQGRLVDHTDPNGIRTHMDYPIGLSHSVTLAYGSADAATTTYTTDALGRLISVQDALGNITNYAYNHLGKISWLSQTGESGTQTRTWSYNSLGWLTGLVQPESGSTDYSDFLVIGKPQTTTYTGGLKVTTQFDDPMGRLTSTTSTGLGGILGVSQSFEYDRDRLKTATDGVSGGWQVKNSTFYDDLGHLQTLETLVTAPITLGVPQINFVQGFKYNDYGFRTSATLPSGRELTYVYDPVQDVASMITYPGTVVANILNFNELFLPKKIQYGNFGNGAGPFTTLNYELDQARLKDMTHYTSAPGDPLRHWAYSYDAAGRLKGDGEDTYDTYDALGRLKKAAVLGLPDNTGTRAVFAQTFDYDAFGNRTSSTFQTAIPTNLSKNLVPVTFNKSDGAWLANHLPNALTGAQYTDQGFLTKIFKRYADGTSLMNLTYDALGRVVTSEDTERNAVEIYSYSPEGLRTHGEYYLSGVLQKIRFNVYNDQRQLVSQFDWLPPASITSSPRLSARTASQAGTSVPRLAFMNGGAK